MWLMSWLETEKRGDTLLFERKVTAGFYSSCCPHQTHTQPSTLAQHDSLPPLEYYGGYVLVFLKSHLHLCLKWSSHSPPSLKTPLRLNPPYHHPQHIVTLALPAETPRRSCHKYMPSSRSTVKTKWHLLVWEKGGGEGAFFKCCWQWSSLFSHNNHTPTAISAITMILQHFEYQG